MMRISARHKDRRRKVRFGIEREAKFKVLEDNRVIAFGAGRTVNISSGGVGLAVDHELKPGCFMELAISWPALLDESCPMRLIVFGRVVWSSGHRAACTVEKWEFRTQARARQDTGVRQDSMLERWAGGYHKECLKTQSAGV